MCLVSVAVRQRSLRRANHSSTGVLPSVTEQPHRGDLGPLRLSRQKKNNV
jgi:hypothetical protein